MWVMGKLQYYNIIQVKLCEKFSMFSGLQKADPLHWSDSQSITKDFSKFWDSQG